MHMQRYRRKVIEASMIRGALRAVALFPPGTYGVLPTDRGHLAAIRSLEKRGLVTTRLVEGVIMVELTEQGQRVSGKRYLQRAA